MKRSEARDRILRSVRQWAAGMMALGVIGCVGMDNRPQAARDAPLYDRLGGKSAVTAVVDQFVANVAGDRRINGRFATTDIPRLKQHLVNQICTGTGGPCTYTGRDMKTTHAGMRISEADFNALVEDLVSALNTFNVPEAERKELLGILGPMKKDIVEVP